MRRSVGEAMKKGRNKDIMIPCALGGKETFFSLSLPYILCQFILKMLQSAKQINFRDNLRYKVENG